MRWFHVLGAILLSLCLSLACLTLVSNFLAPLAAVQTSGSTATITSVTVTTSEGDNLKKSVPILLYHAIGDYQGVGQELFISAETFAEQLDYLRRSGFATISFEELWQHWENDQPLPDKPIIITFDDAYRSFYNLALPMLKAREMTATVFVITNHVTLLRSMTPGMIRDAADEGIEIGSHTHNHLNLTACSASEVEPQLVASKEYLEDLLEKPVQVLAYPGGAQNEQVRNAARSAGYLLAVGTVPGLNYAATDYYQLHRIYVERKDDLSGFIRKIEAFTEQAK